MNHTNNALILNNKLLSIAGYGTNMTEDVFLEQIVSKGFVVDKKVKHYLGVAQQCHLNSTYLWNTNKDKYRLCTGYALFENVWYCHSWLIDMQDDKIVETNPVNYEIYFGAILDNDECVFIFQTLWNQYI